MLFLDVFFTFFKIGLFTFGGGYAMLPLIQAEVAAHSWMDQESLVNFVAVSESTPGPFAINVSTYVGMELGGLPCALCATLGVVLPSFIVILIVARCYQAFQKSRVVIGVMSGLKPAVVGMIGSAVVSVAATVLFPAGVSLAAMTDPAFWMGLAIFALALYLLLKKKKHPVLIIAVSAALGIAAGYLGVFS